MQDPRFPRVAVACTGLILTLVAASCTTTVHLAPTPPPPVQVRVVLIHAPPEVLDSAGPRPLTAMPLRV